MNILEKAHTSGRTSARTEVIRRRTESGWWSPSEAGLEIDEPGNGPLLDGLNEDGNSGRLPNLVEDR
jgi:hypothetical protein